MAPSGGIYSRRLLLASSFTGDQSVTCPAGKRWVVKQIDVNNFGGAALTAWLLVAGYSVAYNQSLGAGQHLTWSGMHVLYAGELLTAHATVNTASFIVSGYEFADP